MSALRPSNLPKLAVCPCYESHPVVGPAAERGTLLDTAFRAELLGLEERFVIANKLTADEIAAVSWSVSMVRAISGRERVLAREDDCRVRILDLTGTADAIVPTRLTHFDLKTGARRNYREQMAAYALGLMGAYFAGEWTAHLLVLRPAGSRDDQVHLRRGARRRRPGGQVVQRPGASSRTLRILRVVRQGRHLSGTTRHGR
jgi:hypothetical protein